MIQSILINGLTLGGVYAILAIGFALVFGVARSVNLTHTGFYMVAAFVIYIGLKMFSFPTLMVVVLAILIAAILAVICYVALIDRVKHHDLAVMIITIATAMVFQEILILFFGGHQYSVPPFLAGFIEIAGVRVSFQRLFAIPATAIVIGCVWMFLWKTRVGLAVRAVSQDMETANLMAIDVRKVSLLTMGIAGVLAGVAAAIVAPIFTVHSNMWVSPLVMILAAVVLGGLGSIKGSILGAFILGLCEVMVSTLVPGGAFLRTAVALAIMVVVLMVKPEGMFGAVFEEERL